MTDYNIRNGGKFGSSSLMLVLIVLCLTTFAFLSLGSTRANEILAEKNAAAVQEYYRADGTGEEFVQRVNQALEEADGINREEIRKQALKTIGEGCLEDVDGVMARIPMAGGQVLQVRLKVNWEERTAEVFSWKVFPCEEEKPGHSLEVWGRER